MANSLGTLSPVEIVLDCIAFLKQKFPVLTTITTDFSVDAVKFNQEVVSRVVIPVAAQDYDLVNGYVAESATTVDVPVTITKHKHVSISLTDQELSSTTRNLLQEQKEAVAYSLGLQIANDLFALITPANFPAVLAPIAAAGNASRSVILGARAELVTAGATLNRYGLVNPGVFAALAEDQTIFAKLYSDIEPDFQDGVIYGLGGFGKIVEVATLPTANKLLGYFGGKEGLILAGRVPADPALMAPGVPIPGLIDNVTDPDTGLTIQYRYAYDMFKGRLQMTLTLMYGVAVGVPGHAVLLLST
jgi:hypothetical protein